MASKHPQKPGSSSRNQAIKKPKTSSIPVSSAEGVRAKDRRRSARNRDGQAKRVVYIHGMGPHAPAGQLKKDYDLSLFGRDIGSRSRLAYYANILHADSSPEVLRIETSENAIQVSEYKGVAESAMLNPTSSQKNKARQWEEMVLKRFESNPLMLGEEEIAEVLEGRTDNADDEGVRESGYVAKVLPGWLPRRSISRWIMDRYIKDVSKYFFNERVRGQMQESLRRLLIPGSDPCVLVSHSLGTIIAYEVLSEFEPGEIDVPLWVTLGSPLGMEEVLDFLDEPHQKPAVVRNWQNFADRLDPVAFDRKLDNDYAGDVEDHLVVNRDTLSFTNFNPHSALGYLSLSAVKETVKDHLEATVASATGQSVMSASLAEEISGAVVPIDVLIELNDRLKGATVTERAALVVDEIITLDPDAADSIDVMKRYVAAKLDPRVLTTLEAKHGSGAIFRMYRNAEKRALMHEAANRLHTPTARLGYEATGAGIGWAVLDTGINAKHPHFKLHNNIAAAWDCTIRSVGPKANGAEDRHGHGTHVAGILAGEESLEQYEAFAKYYGEDVPRGRNIAMAPLAKLHIYKVLGDDGKGSDSYLIKALDHIADVNEQAGQLKIHGVNLSLGGPFNVEDFGCGFSPVANELRRLWRQGVVVCVAAGNEAFLTVQTAEGSFADMNVDLSIGDPANLEECIAVGSVHKKDSERYGVSFFSSKGPTADGRQKPDVVAPGEKISSCNARFIRGDIESHYIEFSGTSMACPHVSGLIAAFLSRRPGYDSFPDKVKELLLNSATCLKRNPYHQGRGIPNLVEMLRKT